MTMTWFSMFSRNPNARSDKPISKRPNPSRYGRLKQSIKYPTIGENTMSPTENDANTTPTNYSPISSSSNTIGRKGAANA